VGNTIVDLPPAHTGDLSRIAIGKAGIQ
jgi:hypothetical protein